MSRSERLIGCRARESGLDEDEIREFLLSDYGRLVGAIGLMCGSRVVAEDAVQEALARAWERTERGETIDSLKAWVTTVAMNVVRSGFRRRAAERRARSRMPDAPPAQGSGGEWDGPATVAADAAADVRRALAGLPRREREATVLRYYLDLDVAQVATALRITEGTAKTTLFRARRAMAASLGAQDLDDEQAEAVGNAGV